MASGGSGGNKPGLTKLASLLEETKDSASHFAAKIKLTEALAALAALVKEDMKRPLWAAKIRELMRRCAE